jgi:signal transduction histidine kinase
MWVSDTGKGIAPEHLERVFERFFKVDEFIPGAGLGLSICRTMAYSLGGTVEVTSTPGEGSTFWFEIPIQ